MLPPARISGACLKHVALHHTDSCPHDFPTLPLVSKDSVIKSAPKDLYVSICPPGGGREGQDTLSVKQRLKMLLKVLK